MQSDKPLSPPPECDDNQTVVVSSHLQIRDRLTGEIIINKRIS